MRSLMSLTRRGAHSLRAVAAVSLSVSLMLVAGCGGGAGGGSGAPPPASANLATLTLTSANAELLAQQIAQKSEVPLTAAQFAAELARRFSIKGTALSLTETCSSASGKLTVALIDRDGDGIASAGDQIAASFDHCNVGLFGDVIGGSLVVELSAPTSLASGTINGVVQLDGTLTLPRLQQIWSGSFKIALARTDLVKSWKVTSSADDDLRVVTASSPADYLRSLALSKSVNYEQARNTVDLSLRYDTPMGVGVVTTPTSFVGYLQRAPDSGVLELQGVNGKVSVVASRGTSTTEARLELSQNGAVKLLSSTSWTVRTKGFLWWDSQTRDQFTGEADLNTQEYATDFLNFSLVAPEPAAVTDAAAVFRFQFRRPPTDLPQLAYRFADLQANDPSSPLWDIPATTERHGALVLVRPTQALRHGHEYLLQASTDGVTWSIPGKLLTPDILVHDAEGHEARIMNGYVGLIRTPNTSHAANYTDFDSLPTASAQVLLSATSRPSTGLSIVRTDGAR